jgi:chromosome partitioning protein
MSIPAQRAPLALNPDYAARVYAWVLGKGGVGKTTGAANHTYMLWKSLWKAGRGPVLFMDFNIQANGRHEFDLSGGGFADDGTMLLDDRGKNLVTSIITGTLMSPVEIPGYPGLYMAVGGGEIETLTSYLSTLDDARKLGLIAYAVNLLRPYFAAIVIDGPPENRLVQAGILAASDRMIAPTKTDPASWEEGIGGVAREFVKVRESGFRNLKLLAAVVTFTDEIEDGTTARATRAAIQEVIGNAGPVLVHTIPHVESVGKLSRRYRTPVCALADRMAAAEKSGEEAWKVGDKEKVRKVAQAWRAVIKDLTIRDAQLAAASQVNV